MKKYNTKQVNYAKIGELFAGHLLELANAPDNHGFRTKTAEGTTLLLDSASRAFLINVQLFARSLPGMPRAASRDFFETVLSPMYRPTKAQAIAHNDLFNRIKKLVIGLLS